MGVGWEGKSISKAEYSNSNVNNEFENRNASRGGESGKKEDGGGEDIAMSNSDKNSGDGGDDGGNGGRGVVDSSTRDGRLPTGENIQELGDPA